MTTDELARRMAAVWLDPLESLPPGELDDEMRNQLRDCLRELMKQESAPERTEADKREVARARRWLCLAAGGWLRMVIRWPLTIRVRREVGRRLVRLLEPDATTITLATESGGVRHSHVCPQCGRIWSHEAANANDEAAHACKCGGQSWTDL